MSPPAAPLRADRPLWEWAVAAYARPQVADLCLQLQDRAGQSAPLLLWAAWARSADPAVLAAAADLARAWEAAAVGHLRAARRGLKPVLPPIDDALRQALRDQVRAVELAAERLLLETLMTLAPPGGPASGIEALAAAVAAWGRPAPADRLAALAAALE